MDAKLGEISIVRLKETTAPLRGSNRPLHEGSREIWSMLYWRNRPRGYATPSMTGIAASLTRLRSLSKFKNETVFNATCEQLFDAPNDLNPPKFPEGRW